MVRTISGNNGWHALVFFGFLLSAFILSLIATTQSHALDSVYISPNPAKFTLEGTNNPRNYLHIIKNADSSQIKELSMAAYFNEPSAGYEIQITDRDTEGARCRITGTQPDFISVTLSTMTTNGQKSVKYTVPYNKICQGPDNSHNAYGSSSANFFGYYKVPAEFTNNLAVRDAATDLYKVNINIAYDNSVRKMPNSGDQQILFRVQLAQCQIGDICTRYLSTVPIGSVSGRNYSTAGQRDPDEYGTETFGFGLPCNVNTDSPNRVVNVYDIDNGYDWENNNRPRKIVFYVERQAPAGGWVRLSRSEIRSVTNATRSSDNKYTQVDGSVNTSKITLDLKARTKYRIVLEPVWHTNLIGVGLPEETIFGDLDCNVGLTGAITTDPATGINPIEAGRSISFFTTATRDDSSDFISRYTSKFSIWYDTGNETPGSERISGGETVIACGDSGTSRLQTGEPSQHTIPLVNCPNVRADTTQSGGRASAICAQLILTPADSITRVSATGGAPPNGLVKCFQIGKRPHFAALNGDVFAGGVIGTPCTLTKEPIIASNKVTIDGVNYSSYGTYGVTSLGRSVNFGSNDLKTGDAFADALLFSNKPVSGLQGYFYNTAASNGIPTNPRCLKDVSSLSDRATITRTGNSANLTTLAVPNATRGYKFTTAGTLSISAAAIPPGAHVLIYAPNADVRITGDITYGNGPYASVGQLPQVVIATDKNMMVNGSVTQMDGIYVAKKDFQTCDVLPRLNTCTNALAVNGSVITGGTLKPYRTSGADQPNYGQPAETFAIRPDSLINQLPAPGDSSVYISTVSEREIPPRF